MQIAGENSLMNFMICAPWQVLLKCSNLGEFDGQGV
jgi:hypothetical protein